jgi:hypothetical protein
MRPHRSQAISLSRSIQCNAHGREVDRRARSRRLIPAHNVRWQSARGQKARKTGASPPEADVGAPVDGDGLAADGRAEVRRRSWLVARDALRRCARNAVHGARQIEDIELFQLAEVAVPQTMFAAILGRIERLRPQPLPASGRTLPEAAEHLMTRLNVSEAAGWRPPRLAQMRPNDALSAMEGRLHGKSRFRPVPARPGLPSMSPNFPSPCAPSRPRGSSRAKPEPADRTDPRAPEAPPRQPRADHTGGARARIPEVDPLRTVGLRATRANICSRQNTCKGGTRAKIGSTGL